VQSGIETAKGIAGGKVVGVNGGTMARQALDASLVDELHVELVPVLLRPGVPAQTPLVPNISVRRGTS
jgi:dihydrofolate reductase